MKIVIALIYRTDPRSEPVLKFDLVANIGHDAIVLILPSETLKFAFVSGDRSAAIGGRSRAQLRPRAS
jgi:hypothetical protein